MAAWQPVLGFQLQPRHQVDWQAFKQPTPDEIKRLEVAARLSVVGNTPPATAHGTVDRDPWLSVPVSSAVTIAGDSWFTKARLHAAGFKRHSQLELAARTMRLESDVLCVSVSASAFAAAGVRANPSCSLPDVDCRK